jgi:hypothetical protein
MAYEVKDNSGSLFQNKDKKTDNHPDYSGSIRIDGKDYWLSGWKKVSNDKPWLSLAIKPKDGAPRPDPEQEFKSAVKQSFPALDDEVPF